MLTISPFLGIMIALGVLIFALSIDKLKLGLTAMLIGAFYMVGPSFILAQLTTAPDGGTVDTLHFLGSFGFLAFYVGGALAFVGWILAMYATTAGSPGAFGFMLLGYLGWPLTPSQRQRQRLYETSRELRQEQSERIGAHH